MPLRELPIVTTSSRTAFRRCPQRWWWQYIEGYQPKGEVPDALWFGIGVHEALASWYGEGMRRGPHPAKTFAKWCDDETREVAASYADHNREEFESARYENALELGVDMLNGYVEEYGKDRNWDVIAIERPFKVKVMLNGKQIAWFMSTWDGIYRDRASGRIFLMEHKTTSQIMTAFLELDDQAGIYWAFAQPILRKTGILDKNEEIEGIMYNYLRKSKADLRPRNAQGLALNKDMTISKRQPPQRYLRHLVERSPGERQSQVFRLADEVSWMNAMLRGDMPVTKSTSKECTFCPFFTMCKVHERGGEAWKQIARIDFVKGEPFDRYLKSAAA